LPLGFKEPAKFWTISASGWATLGSSTSGVLQIDRTTGIVAEARQQLYLRNLLTARPTALGIVDFVKVNSAMAVASMQIESSAKAENAETFTTSSEKVQTVASWIPASRQVLDDMAELAGFINTSLMYSVNLREEIEMQPRCLPSARRWRLRMLLRRPPIFVIAQDSGHARIHDFYSFALTSSRM